MSGRQKVAAGWTAFVRGLLVAGLCGASALGCSSSEDESSKSASLQCDDFEDAYCAKVVACAQTSDRSDFQETCAFSWRVYLPCDQVGYAEKVVDCLSGINAIACSGVPAGSFPNLPEQCQGIFGSQ
jgi:hypothetical protein